MSQWTHVCGAIRFDGLLLNHTVACTVIQQEFMLQTPEGSEGPLNTQMIYTGHQDGNSGSLSIGTLVISGDLRDYDDVDYIYEWIKDRCKLLKNKHVLIRDMSITIEVEFRQKFHITIWYPQLGDREITMKDIQDLDLD